VNARTPTFDFRTSFAVRRPATIIRGWNVERISESIELVLAFTATVALLCLAPGPDILYVIAHGTAGGRRAGVVATSGVSAELLGNTIAAAAGLTFSLAAAPRALDVVRVLGAVMLVYLAVTTWRAAGRDSESGLGSPSDNSGPE